MNNSETLYTPIQINGCISENESNATQLYPRELYITKEGRLITGNPKSADQKALTSTLSELTIHTALVSKALEYNSDDCILDTTTKTIKGFTFESANIKSARLGSSTIAINNNALQFDLNTGSIRNGSINTSNLTNVTLNLKPYDNQQKIGSWGTTLPENPSVGDVFILI